MALSLSPVPPLSTPRCTLCAPAILSFLQLLRRNFLFHLSGPLHLPQSLLDFHSPFETAKGHLRMGWPTLLCILWHLDFPAIAPLTQSYCTGLALCTTPSQLWGTWWEWAVHFSLESTSPQALCLGCTRARTSYTCLSLMIDKIKEIRPSTPGPSLASFVSVVL